MTSRVSDGSCEPGSEAIGEGYRCSAGNYIYDPCWPEKAATPAVLCMSEPWLRTVTQVRLNTALQAIPGQDGGSAEPWGLQLADGNRCELAQGAHEAFDGTVLDYACTPSGLALLRGISRTRAAWTARSAVYRHGEFSLGPTEKIAIAWYGSWLYPDKAEKQTYSASSRCRACRRATARPAETTSTPAATGQGFVAVEKNGRRGTATEVPGLGAPVGGSPQAW